MNTSLSHPMRAGLACAAAFLSLAGAVLAHAADAARPEKPVALFNGRDLAGWVIVGRDGDPAAQQTWSVRDGVLAASGSPYGYVRTDKAYRDYVLRIEWRWVPGEAPLESNGKPRGRNSGVLLHIQGEDKVWPTCLEAQLYDNSAGDFIAMGPSVVFDELTAAREKAAAGAADQAARQRALANRRIAREHDSSEKPHGEWNLYEIVCRGDVVTLTVNGVLQNTARGLSLQEGTIGLQSEGMPIEFRRVELAPLE